MLFDRWRGGPLSRIECWSHRQSQGEFLGVPLSRLGTRQQQLQRGAELAERRAAGRLLDRLLAGFVEIGNGFLGVRTPPVVMG